MGRSNTRKSMDGFAEATVILSPATTSVQHLQAPPDGKIQTGFSVQMGLDGLLRIPRTTYMRSVKAAIRGTADKRKEIDKRYVEASKAAQLALRGLPLPPEFSKALHTVCNAITSAGLESNLVVRATDDRDGVENAAIVHSIDEVTKTYTVTGSITSANGKRAIVDFRKTYALPNNVSKLIDAREAVEAERDVNDEEMAKHQQALQDVDDMLDEMAAAVASKSLQKMDRGDEMEATMSAAVQAFLRQYNITPQLNARS